MIRIRRPVAIATVGLTCALGARQARAQTRDNPEVSAPTIAATAEPSAPAPPPPPPLPPAPAPASPPPETVQANETRQPGQSEAPEGAKPVLQERVTMPEWMKGLTLGGGVLLWYYQPFSLPQTDNDMSVFWARLLLDGKWGAFGLHLEPRFRDTKLRPFFDGPVWLQEAYASADLGKAAQLRVGKTYSQLGIFWYTSFYGNVQVYDGLKLDPDYGATLQGELGKAKDTLSLGWWAQYFIIDGGTNVSLEGRDTISYTGAHRRNQAIGRIEPRLHVGPATFALGGSAEYLQATGLPGLDTQNVWRAAGDLTFTAGGLTLRGEYLHQDGYTVTAFPIAATPAMGTTPATPGAASKHNNYLLAGGEYTLGPVTAVFTASLGSYDDVAIKQWMYVPALSVAVSPNISLLGEVVFWQNIAPTATTLVDRSFNLTLNAHL